MENVVILSAVRTPIGAYGGALRDIPAYRLGAVVLNEAARRAGIEPEQVDDVIMGVAYQNGENVNAARMALLEADWPDTIPGVVLDRRCCSGIDSLFFGAMKIQTGNAEIVMTGGMESMSQAELYIPGDIKWGLGGRSHEKHGFMPKGHGALAIWGIPLYDRIQRGRVMSQPIRRYGELNSMMSWAETAAKREGITRVEADRWALRSHQRAVAAWESGIFPEEVVPVRVPQDRGNEVVVDRDEGPRNDTSMDKLSKLRPVYPDGVCTAGNSSSENDGASVVVLASERKARALGKKPLGYYRCCAVAATNPVLTYPAVPDSVSKALGKLDLNIDQIDLIEIQEAFAVQTLADAKLMGVWGTALEQKVNVNGSGISLGHPVGATGAIRLTTLLHEMRRRDVRFGLETICGGGGHGICLVVERK
ncbi:MAG: thiolase family protein [Deltaproteobacteria bacterium]|nr:thiolase family protein [Deltaproteobacteria bacterium]